MIKNYLFAFLLFLFYKSNAQVTIPDANFKNTLINTTCANTTGDPYSFTMDVDTNNDGEISTAEAEAIKALRIIGKEISSLQGIEAFTNLEILYCSKNQLTTLDLSSNVNLKIIQCSQNELTTLDLSSNVNLKIIQCSQNELTTLDISNSVNLVKILCNQNELTALNLSNNINLIEIQFSGNQLTNLNILPHTELEILSCSKNLLSSLDITNNVNLKNLYCRKNKLISLNILNNTNLETIYADDNDLTTLNTSNNTALRSLSLERNSIQTLDVTQNKSLTYFNAAQNFDITTIDVTNNLGLEAFQIEGNDLTSINVSQNSELKYLGIGRNKITSLDVSNNPELRKLSCSGTPLGTLDVTANPNLTQLYCSRTNISSLDVSQNPNLQLLWCGDTTLQSLDVTQNSKLDDLRITKVINSLDVTQNTLLKILSCNINGATELDLRNNPNLKGLRCYSETLRFLYLKNNANLFENFTNCEGNYPNFFNLNTPNIEYICADEPELVCVQKELDEKGYTNCSIGTNCSYNSNKVVGQTAFDSDANGCDTNDPIVPFVKYTVSNNSNADNYTYIGAQSGNYIIPLDDGNYTIAPVFENPTYFTNTPANVTVDFPTQPSPFNQDFCIAANGTNNDLEIVVIPLAQARPGFNALYKLLYKNKGNTVLSGNITLAFQEDYMNFDSSIPNITSQAPSLLTWDYQDLLPNQMKTIEFSMTLNQPNHPNFPLNSGDVINFTGTINPTLNDATPLDNTNTLNQTIVNSYDPNDIRCLEGAKIQEDEVGNFVHYIIRFENEGTASAINISVKNEIDITKFDVASLLPLYGSHPFTTTITEGNKLEFRFEGINLSHEENNQGYVVFKMKTANTLIAGDTFEETADIFFDFNSAITTNTAITTVEGTLSVKKYNDTLELYPNPVTNSLTITSKEQIESIRFLDISGRLIKTVEANNSLKAELTVSSFLPGTYFIKIKTATTTFTKRMIKK